MRFVLLAGLIIGLLAAASARAEPGDVQHLQGTWQVQWWEQEGKVSPAAELKNCTVFFGGDLLLIRDGRAWLQTGTFTLDSSKNPKHITVQVKDGAHKGATMLGIYEIRGEILRLCFAVEGMKRPTAFRTTAASGLLLLECKRTARPADEAIDITGVYRVEAAELTDLKQVIEAAIERKGDAYVVTYRKNKAPIYSGIGIRQGNTLSFCWSAAGESGVSVFQIETGPRLVGQYTILGGSGVLAKETLAFVAKEP
jgi:uncharacterized protein (TIGR03067 family)